MTPPSQQLVGSKGHAAVGRYADIGPLHMYYEVHGKGAPVVLVHGGGSTIQTSFGRLLPRLAMGHQVIAVELQGHGHTADVDRPLSFAQDADDVAALLQQLGVAHADFIGYSNGGTTSVQIAIRHPSVIRRLVLISAAIARAGLTPELRETFDREPRPEGMPASLRAAYLAVAPRPQDLPVIVAKSVRRMRDFADISPTAVRAIDAPALVISGDLDVVRPEHSVEMFRTFRHGALAILPWTDHMAVVEREELLMPIIAPFLDAPALAG
jgi:pimeloyl-ACP methyl ester carboxylesterase